jgi:hypothetical protein
MMIMITAICVFVKIEHMTVLHLCAWLLTVLWLSHFLWLLWHLSKQWIPGHSISRLYGSLCNGWHWISLSRLEKSIPPHPVTTLYLVAIIPQCRPWWMPLWEGCVFGVHAAGGGDTVLIDMHSFDECCCCRWLVAVLAEVCWWVCHCLTSDTSEHMDRRWSGMHMDNDEEWLMIYGQMHGEWAQMYGGECDQTVPN